MVHLATSISAIFRPQDCILPVPAAINIAYHAGDVSRRDHRIVDILHKHVPSQCARAWGASTVLGIIVASRCRSSKRPCCRRVSCLIRCAGNSEVVARRPLIASVASSVCAGSASANAAITGGVREAIADISANIPGYGPGDIYYPSWFLGDWATTSELVKVETPQGDQFGGEAVAKARARLGTPAAIEAYTQRFISYRDKIIADRGYNMRSLVQGAGGPRSVESIDWDPTNPNAMTMTFKRSGLSVQADIRITRRASAIPEGREDLFNASEFYEQVVDSGGGSPEVTPTRCVSKFKRVAGPQIQLIQRVEVFPGIGNSRAGEAKTWGESYYGTGQGEDRDKPVAIYKYRILLVPRESSAADNHSTSA